jgi:uncharacterized protein YukE
VRIDSKAEAERAWRNQHDHQSHAKLDKPTIGHADHGDKHITGVGMDGIEVTPEMLTQADSELDAAQQELLTHIKRATNLHGPLGDGHGPVAQTMASSFLDRASLEGGGVQAALQNYYTELQNVRDAIKQTLDTYQAVDTGVAEDLSRQSTEGQA